MRLIKSKSTLTLLFIGVLGLFFCVKAYFFPPHDFSNYYFGAYFLGQGEFGNWIYYPHLFNQAIADLGHDHVFVSFAPNTPFLAQFFILFSWMSLATAKLVFNLVSLFLFLFSLRKLMGITAVNPLYFGLIPLVFFIPLQNNFLFGQVYLLLFFLLVEGWFAYRNESFWKMGILWGLAIGLKLSPIFIVGWLVVKKKWKPLAYLAGVGFMFLSFSVFWSGFEVWEFYLQQVLSKSGAGEITEEYVQNYQSFHMLMKAVLSDSPQLFASLLLAYKLVLIALAVLVSKKEQNELKLMGVWLLIGILISPYGSTYSLLFLIFVAVYLFANGIKSPKLNWIAIGIIGAICFTPVHFVATWPFPLSFPRLFLLFVLLIMLIYKSIDTKVLLKVLGVIILIVSLKAFLLSLKINKSDAFLIENQPLLVYDYGVENGKLVYRYWTDNGAESTTTDIIVNTLTPVAFNAKELSLFGTTNLYKAAIMNDTTLIYLSDEKRGIGFYALHSRKLSTED